MPAGSGTASRTTVVLLAFAGVAVILTLARVAMAETVLRYDAAGHLLGVSNSDDDPDGCGVPPVACPDDPHGQPICTGGWCGLQCDPGWTDAYGRCADTSSDPTACGPDMAACPAPDHGTATCDQGVCGASCEAGFVASGSKCVSLSTDPGNCGALRKGCPNVPGYVACCSASVCGASDGIACVNVSTDPTNCGWIGHACGPVGANPASCSKGRCAKPAWTPRVDSVNGVAPTGQVFRSPFWSGITLTGANLHLVTWVELEDWGADTVDGSPEGVQSVPSARVVTLPTGSGGPTVHFQQTSTTLTVDAASLEFQAAFDPRFETREWLKVRIHYTASGVDRSILTNVAVSLTDLVSQGLPPPSITGVASYETWTTMGYDPATGLLALYDDPTGLAVVPSSILSPDLQHEFPILEVLPEGLRLEWGGDWEDLDNTTGCYDCFDSALPVGVVMTLRGKWLGTIDRMTSPDPPAPGFLRAAAGRGTPHQGRSHPGAESVPGSRRRAPGGASRCEPCHGSSPSGLRDLLHMHRLQRYRWRPLLRLRQRQQPLPADWLR